MKTVNFLTILGFFWGLLPTAGATLQGSQVCSAPRRFAPWSAASPPPFASLGRLACGQGASPLLDQKNTQQTKLLSIQLIFCAFYKNGDISAFSSSPSL